MGRPRRVSRSVVDTWTPAGYEGVTTASLDAMSDEDYAAFYTDLRAAVQAEADAWWPHYVEALCDGVLLERLAVTTNRPRGGIRVTRHGEPVGVYDFVPEEYEGLSILDAIRERSAIDVTPPKRIKTAEPARVEPPSDPAEGMLVDVGEPWQWRPWNG